MLSVLQAIGRIRRYGQTKPVKIVRLFTADTVDIRIYQEMTGLNVAELIEEQELADPTFKARIRPTQRPLNRVLVVRVSLSLHLGYLRASILILDNFQ